MKTIIIYDSKKGFTEDCAIKISESLKCDIISLKDKMKFDLNTYDLIIIGTPIYMGKIMKRVNHFIDENVSILKDKKIAFFICGIGNPFEMIDLFKKQINADVTTHSLVIKHFGGELRPDRSHFLMKVIMQKMVLDPNFKSHIDENEINAFIKKIKEIKQ